MRPNGASSTSRVAILHWCRRPATQCRVEKLQSDVFRKSEIARAKQSSSRALRKLLEQVKTWIHSHEVSLAGGNVIMVDAVDQPDGPLVRRVVHVEPVADNTGGNRTDVVQPQTFIRRSPELVAYLQCDHQFDDPRPYVHQMLKAMCDAVMLP